LAVYILEPKVLINTQQKAVADEATTKKPSAPKSFAGHSVQELFRAE